jgi:maleate isomerase
MKEDIMTDRYGPRGVFAIVAPLQNANMQPEFERLRPDGISNQIYRFDISNHDSAPDAVVSAIPGTLGCWPDLILCGNSVEMADWSVEKQRRYLARLEEKAKDVPVLTATDACQAALQTLNAQRLAILSPMGEKQARGAQQYYKSLGYDVPHVEWLDIKKSEDIIRVTDEKIQDAFRRLNHDEVDTFLHLGGALPLLGMISNLEQSLERSVVSTNAASYWYALRRHGIKDRVHGYGRLLLQTDIG